MWVEDLGEGFLPTLYACFQPIHPFLAPTSSLLSGISLAFNFLAFSGTEQVDQLLTTGTVVGLSSFLLSHHQSVNSSPLSSSIMGRSLWLQKDEIYVTFLCFPCCLGGRFGQEIGQKRPLFHRLETRHPMIGF